VTRAVAPDFALARKVLQTEAAAILALVDRLDERFDRAVELLRQCRGRVILTGMGKSGIICQKIAATLSSTGTPAGCGSRVCSRIASNEMTTPT